MQFSIRHIEQTESTNILIFKLLEDNPVEGIVVTAHTQTQGRGQQGTT
jgi:biotin-(acetyl-CoA carboxylase) ligase